MKFVVAATAVHRGAIFVCVDDVVFGVAFNDEIIIDKRGVNFDKVLGIFLSSGVEDIAVVFGVRT